MSLPRRRSKPLADAPSSMHAVAALLVCAASADGSVLPVEANRLEDAMKSMPVFAECQERHLQLLVEQLHEDVVRYGPIEVARCAAAFVPPPLRLAVFRAAAEIIFSDGRQRTSERIFLEDLRSELRIGRQAADAVIDVMTARLRAWPRMQSRSDSR